jgi:hypothetical protein
VPVSAVQALLAPFTGAHTEPPFEAGIEKTEMVEVALFRNFDDFGIGVPQ